MPFHFCPQCGTKLQPEFRFCPSCGEKLPGPDDEEPGALTSAGASGGLTPGKQEEVVSSQACFTSTSVSTRPALKKTRNSLRVDTCKDVAPPVVASTDPVRSHVIKDIGVGSVTSPPKQHKVTFQASGGGEPTLESSTFIAANTPRPTRGKSKLSSPAVIKADEGKKLMSGSPLRSPVSSPNVRSPKGKSKAKKSKSAAAVEPLLEGEEVTDTTGRKWRLVKLLNQTVAEIMYEVVPTASRCKESDHILKLGSKDGRIFNEQNFLQRAAKPASVDKWIKQNKMASLGLPSCVGFGTHADSYRFLIFPNMGQTLQTIIDEDDGLSEKAVLHLACRLLDVLHYIHSNEYVHADINAENILVGTSQVYLGGYCHAFRYCPGGQHVGYREDSRTPHEGATEFISLDIHKGAAPSRRSDLQSLGYCMLRWHTGPLPWSDITQPEEVAAHKKKYMDDVPALLSHGFGRTKVPSAFHSFLCAVMSLQYCEQPDYSALKDGLSSALEQMGGSQEETLTF